MAKKQFSDLSKGEQTKGNLLGTNAKAALDVDSAVLGPLQIQHPQTRIMTGAISAAHGAEQAAAVTASGASKFKPITETGSSGLITG